MGKDLTLPLSLSAFNRSPAFFPGFSVLCDCAGEPGAPATISAKSTSMFSGSVEAGLLSIFFRGEYILLLVKKLDQLEAGIVESKGLICMDCIDWSAVGVPSSSISGRVSSASGAIDDAAEIVLAFDGAMPAP